MFHVEQSTWEKGKIFCEAPLFPTINLCGVQLRVLVDCVVELPWEMFHVEHLA